MAYKSATEYFDLNNYTFDIASAIISGGIQEIDIDTTRGYLLEDTDEFNKVVISKGSLVGTKQYYEVQIGQKISWQEWNKNFDCDTVFYDKTKDNDNLNYKSSNYSDVSGYNIVIGIMANVSGLNSVGTAVNTYYLTKSPSLTIKDYEDNTNWTVTKATYSADGSVAYGTAIRKDADTRVEFTFVRSSAFRVGYDFWGVMRIEEFEQPGYVIDELSSEIVPMTTSLLQPVLGETKLKITVTPGSNTIVCEGLIDHTKLNQNKEYNVSCEIEDGGSVIKTMRYEDSSIMYNEDGLTPFYVE